MPKVSKDGVALYYQEAGKGRPIILIHGAACDHTFMQPQFDYFQKDHLVVSVDLRGHGLSDKPRQEYTMAGFAQDVAWLCGQLGLEKVAVAGHSMGGSVALKVAADFPHLVSAAAALDSTVISSRRRLEKDLPPLVQKLKRQDYLEAFRQYFGTVFEPYDDQRRKNTILEKMCATPQHVIVSLFEEFMAWDGVETAAAVKAPFLYMAATQFRTDVNLLKELCPHLISAQVAASGHFLQLEVPEQVNLMLERFFRVAGV